MKCALRWSPVPVSILVECSLENRSVQLGLLVGGVFAATC